MKVIREDTILNVMKGATLLASGGGGALNDGIIMLEAFKHAHPNTKIEVQVIKPSEMSVQDRSVVVAVMGAPSGGTNLDITPCVLSAYDEAKKVAAGQGIDIQYTLPIEMGGFNTFVPMLISLTTNAPIIDADACGRAVPALDTILSHINGCKTSPVVLANIYDDRATIYTEDPHDAFRIQSLASPIVSRFEQNAGIAGWMLDRNEIQTCIPNDTITLASRIGAFITWAEEDGVPGKNIFSQINMNGLCKAHTLLEDACVFNFKTELSDGWDTGEFYVGCCEGDSEGMYHVKFSNESLLLYEVSPNGRENLIMTAPDIITLYNTETYMPLTNEDLQVYKEQGTLEDQRVTLGVIEVSKHWWLHADKTQEVWLPYFKRLGYDGAIIRYPF